jgi:hypothetical protein
MANRWTPDCGVQEQIEDSVKGALVSARSQMLSGPRLAECGDPIPQTRRKALRGVRTCVAC